MVNTIYHPVFEHLPERTKKKLQSPVSEDLLTWDCFFGLAQARALGATLARAFATEEGSFAAGSWYFGAKRSTD